MNNLARIFALTAGISLAVHAQNYSECQAPDAHMNPKCNGSAPSQQPATAQVGGFYSVTGKTPDGGRYEGSVTISGDDSAGYTFSWTIGEQQYSGTGTRDGNTITVDWGADSPVVYKVSSDGATLNGKWGSGGKGREKLKRQ